MKVFKTNCLTSDDVFLFVSAKSEGRLFCTREPVDKIDFWEVEIAPTNGVSSPAGVSFPKDNNLSSQQIEDQIHQFERSEFKSVGPAPNASGWTWGIATDLGNSEAAEAPTGVPNSETPKSLSDDVIAGMLADLKPR